jgi:uncharacterized protein (DUF302 family)
MLSVAFDEVVARTIDALKKEGSGVLTEIDVRETLKKKIGVDFPSYRILGACNPALAYEALKLENKVGTMLAAVLWNRNKSRAARAHGGRQCSNSSRICHRT